MTDFAPIKPPLDEVLEHHGVKGMHWGVRRGEGTYARPDAYEIRTARRDVRKSGIARKEQVTALKKAKANTTDPEKQKQIDAQIAKAYSDYRNNPNRVTASRTTVGEKIVSIILAGPTGGASIGLLAGVAARSRGIEYRQNKNS